MTQTIDFNQLTGGLNIRQVDTLINTGTTNTEFSYLENLTSYQSGGLTSHQGILSLLSTVSDTTPVIAMAEYSSESENMIVYQKASGAIRFISINGGAEPTPVATGITAPCLFKQFANVIVGVNGVNVPFTCTPTTYASVTTPHPDWSNASIGQPNRIAIHNSLRVVVTVKNNIYISALGNPNNWTHPNDAFNLSGAFGDFTDIRAVQNYGEVTAFHSASNGVKLLTGDEPDNYQITPIEAPQSCQARLGTANANRGSWYVSSRGIYALSVNEFGKILWERDTELSRNIRPIFQNISNPYGNITNVSQALLISNPARNELVFAPRMDNETTYRGQFIFNFDNATWEYKKTVPFSMACYAHGSMYITDGRTSNPASGQIYRDGATFSLEDATPFIKKMATGYLDFGDKYAFKKINHLFFRFQAGTSTDFTLNFYVDNNSEIVESRNFTANSQNSTYGTAIYDTTIYSTQSTLEHRFPLQFRFKTLKVELVCSTPITDFRLLSLGFEVSKGDNK